MAVGSKLTKRKGKISKSDLEKGRKPSVLTYGWPDVTKLSKEEKFLNKLQDLIDSGIEIDEEDIPDDMLDTWEEFKEDITPKLVKKNLAFWTAIFAPVIIPGLVKGMRSEPTVPQPKVIIKGRQQEVIPPAKPREIVDYAKKYFEERGLELCKSLTETDLSRLKEDLKQNWGKGEEAFSENLKESYPVSKSRLETIYRSERHISEYAGVLERAKAVGHSYKRWETVGDERTCDVCLAMDGEFAPIGENFSNGQMFPSAHPRCRCSMTTYSEEDYDELPDEYIRQDSAYLNEASNFMKLNYKCPKGSHDEGFGCGEEDKSETFTNKISVIEPSESQLILKGTRKPSSAEIQTVSKVIRKIPSELLKWAGDLDIRKTGLELVVTKPEYEASPNHGWTSHAMTNRVYLQQDVLEGKDTEHPYGEGTIKHELIHALVGSKIESYIPGGGKAILTKENIRMPIHAYDSNHNGGSIDEFYTMVMDQYEGNGKFNDEELAKIEVEKELGKGTWGDYLHSSKWTPEELTKVKNVALKWTNDKNMLDTFLNTERKLHKWEEEDTLLQQQDASYLNDVAFFIKQNRKCKAGTYDNTNACGPSDENITKNISNVELTPKEKSLIAGYTHTSYAKVNYDLRHPNKAFRTKEDKKLISDTISVMEKVINHSPLKEDMVLYRGMGDKFVADNFDNLKGSIIQDNGFVSTTTDIDKAGKFAGVGKIETKSPARIVARIVAPKGTNALRIGEYDESSPEKEFVLQHGTKFEVIGTEKTKGTWFVDMKVVQSQKQNSYLSEVSEFLKLNKKCKVGTYDDSNKCGPEKETEEGSNKFDVKNINPVETRETIAGLSHIEMWKGLPAIVKSNAPKLSAEETILLDKYFSKEKYSHAINKASYNPDSSTKSIIEKGNKIESIINRSTLPIDIVSFSGASDNEIKELLSKNTISSFVSTSMDKNITYKFGKNIIEFRLPKGTNALIPGYELNQFNEHEVLLNRNTKFDIVSDTIVNSPIEHHYVIVTPRIESKLFSEVSTSFNPELGGFHTTDYKTPQSNKPLRVISQDKADNPKLLDAIKDLDPKVLPSQFLVMKMKGNVPAKYYAKTDSIGVDKSLSSSEMAVEIRKALDSMKSNSSYLEDVADFMKLNYKCKREDSPDGSNKCSDTSTSSDLKSLQSQYKELSAKKEFTSWDEMAESNRKLKELNKKISKEVKKTIGSVPPGFKPNKEGFFTTTRTSYGSIRPNPTGEGWISKTVVRSSTGKGPMSGIVEELHPNKDSAINYIRKELKLPTDQVSQPTVSKYGIRPTENNDINTGIKNASIFHELNESDFDNLTSEELDEFSKWSADEGIYGTIKKSYNKYMKKLVESGEWRDEEHPTRNELGLNSSYLQEAADYLLLQDATIKLNINCSDEEKNGRTGPGSCGGSTDNNMSTVQTEKYSTEDGNNIFLIRSDNIDKTRKLIVDRSMSGSTERKKLLSDILSKGDVVVDAEYVSSMAGGIGEIPDEYTLLRNKNGNYIITKRYNVKDSLPPNAITSIKDIQLYQIRSFSAKETKINATFAQQKALKNSEKQAFKDLSTPQIKLARMYTRANSYRAVESYNLGISQKKGLENAGRKITKLLDKLIENTHIEPGTMLWKGLNLNNVKLPDACMKEGSEFSYKNFNSFTASLSVAKDYSTLGKNWDTDSDIFQADPAIIEVRFPKGGKGLLLSGKHSANEFGRGKDVINEVVLPRNQRFRVVSSEKTPFGNKIIWEAI